MRGNSLADEYAKAGVELHGVTEQHSLEIRALAKIAYQAARWATIQYTTMVQEQHKDSDMLQPKQKPLHPKRKAPQPKQQASTTGPESARHKYKYNSHRIKAATVSDGTLVLFCSTCGAYKWKRTGKLGSVCPGHPTGGRGQATHQYAQRIALSEQCSTLEHQSTPSSNRTGTPHHQVEGAAAALHHSILLAGSVERASKSWRGSFFEDHNTQRLLPNRSITS